MSLAPSNSANLDNSKEAGVSIEPSLNSDLDNLKGHRLHRFPARFRQEIPDAMILEQLAKESGRTVSDFMRQKLQSIKAV